MRAVGSGPAATGMPGRQLLTQDPLLELPQLRGRVEAELVGEPGAEAGEGGECVALPAAGDQGLHEHADGPLSQRLGGHQRLELRHGLRGPTRRQQRLRVLLDGSGPQLGEPRDLGGQRVVVQLRVRTPPPERQRGSQTVPTGHGVVEGRRRGEMVRERRHVDARAVRVQPVAVRRGGEPDAAGSRRRSRATLVCTAPAGSAGTSSARTMSARRATSTDRPRCAASAASSRR